jgi:hypothetical protein
MLKEDEVFLASIAETYSYGPAHNYALETGGYLDPNDVFHGDLTSLIYVGLLKFSHLSDCKEENLNYILNGLVLIDARSNPAKILNIWINREKKHFQNMDGADFFYSWANKEKLIDSTLPETFTLTPKGKSLLSLLREWIEERDCCGN